MSFSDGTGTAGGCPAVADSKAVPITEAARTALSDGSEHPYSPARAVGGFVFVSGALSIDEYGTAVEGTLPALDAAMQRLSERLATAGATLADVVRTTYFVTDIAIRGEANRHYESTFETPRPARTFVEVSRLPYGASVEIEAIAHVNEHERTIR